MDDQVLGFIGLGNIGGPIAATMVNAGIKLHVHDINQEAVGRLVALGAIAQPSPQAVANVASIVCTCLSSLEASEAVLFGDDGIIHGSKITTFVEMSTIGHENVAAFATILARRQISTVDAPVSGGTKIRQFAEGATAQPALAAGGARNSAARTITIMVAGPDGPVKSVMPVFSAISSSVRRVGLEPGQGQLMKLINNLLVGANLAAAVEALTLGARLGLDPAAMIEVISISSGQSYILDSRGPCIASRQFNADSGGKISLLSKDFALALAESRRAGVPMDALPTLSGALSVWDSAMKLGLADRKISELITVIERNLPRQ
jgi:3-hydroxyisobutyrate dehydrogenase-like beta-hydroxyacid dehydrogenase